MISIQIDSFVWDGIHFESEEGGGGFQLNFILVEGIFNNSQNKKEEEEKKRTRTNKRHKVKRKVFISLNLKIFYFNLETIRVSKQ